MITRDPEILRQMGMTGDGVQPVLVSRGLGNYSETYRGWRISKWVYQGPGPVGRWCWAAKNEAGLIIGETEPTFREDPYDITLQATAAIDRIMDEPAGLNCPGCGRQGMTLPGLGLAECVWDGCEVKTWNPAVSLAENEAEQARIRQEYEQQIGDAAQYLARPEAGTASGAEERA